MYYLINIGIIIATFFIFGTVGRVARNLFRDKRLSYLSSYRILWFSSFVMYAVITICITLIFLHIATWLGVIVGVLTFIGMFLNPERPISKDVKDTLEQARSER